jgi:tRNA pseudouridine13 synthase
VGEPSALDRLLAVQRALPLLTRDLPAVTGSLKQSPEHFIVEELPAYPPAGSGEHLYLWIEKRDLNTNEAVARLARALGASTEGAGYAGLKDRRAVTRQWVSFQHAATPSTPIELEGVRVLEVSRHANKLRTGHLRGNRFTIRLADVPPEHDAHVRDGLARISELGLPNYFGTQRFGFEGKNVSSAYAWVAEGGRAPAKPFLRKLLVSALQSALFNVWLAERLERGALLLAEHGDILRKEESGGPFVCSEPEIDTARIASWEISPTGPLFGARMRAPEAEALERETELLARYGITPAHLERVRKFGEGARRPARVRVQGCETRREGGDLVLTFALPKGSYATVLLGELTKSPSLTLGDDP